MDDEVGRALLEGATELLRTVLLGAALLATRDVAAADEAEAETAPVCTRDAAPPTISVAPEAGVAGLRVAGVVAV